MEKEIGASKEECIKIIEAAFDEVISTLKGMDDITHHRAQAIVYLRMNGLVPPGYRAF